MGNVIDIKERRGEVEWVHQCGCGCQKFYLAATEPGSVRGNIDCARCGKTQPTMWFHNLKSNANA